MSLPWVPVIMADEAGNRTLNGQAVVETDDENNQVVKITLTTIDANALALLMDLSVEYTQRTGRSEVVISRKHVEPEPEFRIKGL